MTNTFASVAKCFEHQVTLTPTEIAVCDVSKSLSYDELNKKSNQIANWLLHHGANQGDYIAVALTAGIEYIITILGIIKIGAAYLPIDKKNPPSRIDSILKDASLKILITDEYSLIKNANYQAYFSEDIFYEAITYADKNLDLILNSENPLYMMYTSGTSGNPKGVIISHQAVIHLTVTVNYADIKNDDVMAQFSNCAFDASTFEIWSALLNGAKLQIVPENIRASYPLLNEFLKNSKINYLFFPTSYYHQIINICPAILDKVTTLIVGGEQINASATKNFLDYRKKNQNHLTLINGYGPTEATTFSCRFIAKSHLDYTIDDLNSIGMAIPGIKAYVLNEQLKPTNLGEEGELYISGVNLAYGYHHAEALTRTKFLDNPFEGNSPYQKMYKSGDLVKMLPNNNIYYLGRIDDQVKIGGFRIHLSEIEKVLLEIDGVEMCIVTVDKSLNYLAIIAHIQTKEKNITFFEVMLRKKLEHYLPYYMIPTKIIFVENFVLNTVGKIDKSALIKNSNIFQLQSDNSVLAVIQKVLNKSEIDIDRNFFELGITSILLTEICYLLESQLSIDIELTDVLAHPTIRKLDQHIQSCICN